MSWGRLNERDNPIGVELAFPPFDNLSRLSRLVHPF